jgi:hypothetical protein
MAENELIAIKAVLKSGSEVSFFVSDAEKAEQIFLKLVSGINSHYFFDALNSRRIPSKFFISPTEVAAVEKQNSTPLNEALKAQ